MKKSFSFLQLFSIIDGRLSGSMDDVYDILNHVFNSSLQTIELPTAYAKLKNINPDWFKDQKEVLRGICVENFGITNPEDVDFQDLIDIIKSKYNTIVEVPQLKF